MGAQALSGIAKDYLNKMSAKSTIKLLVPSDTKDSSISTGWPSSSLARKNRSKAQVFLGGAVKPVWF